MTDTTASNTADSQPIISYKGFDKDFRCRGYQYAVGQTYTHDWGVEACVSGFHACPMPLSVFNFYPPAGNRFAVVEQSGKMDAMNDKVASSELTVNAEISMSDLIKAQVEWVWSNLKSAASCTGDQSAASCTGDQSAALSSGNESSASVDGKQSIAIASGINAIAKASKGSWIVLVERDEDGTILGLRAGQAGVDVTPDIFYRLKDGAFVIAE